MINRKSIINICLSLCLLASTAILSACGGDDGGSNSGQKIPPVDQDEHTTTATIDETYEYKLPVIFHVIYQDGADGSQYIPSARLQQLLQYVNMIYQGGIIGESEGVKLRFVAAEYDENGNKLAMPGVEYVKWTEAYPISPSEFMSDNTGKYVKYLWNPNEYINVMMYNFKNDDSDGTVLGISHMPYTLEGSDALVGLETTKQKYITKRNLRYAHCVSINSLYANRDASGKYYQSDRYTSTNHQATYISPMDVVVTLAHELGHYLGLFHTFSETHQQSSTATTLAAATDGCEDTDYCDDTPSYNRSEYIDYLEYYMKYHTSPLLDDVLRRQTCEGDNFSSDNIMDYAYTLGYKITPEQKQRIRNVLYYSPMIPGPKKNGANTRAANTEQEGKIDLRPIIAK